MHNPIQITHKEVVITYEEQTDRWLFTLRGRDRMADSLAAAKEAIDKPVPAEKSKPFQKIPAWWLKYNDDPEKIEITGIADKDYCGRTQVWIRRSSGQRSKETTEFAIYASDEKTDALAAKIIEGRNEIAALMNTNEKLRRQMSPVKLVIPE